jgi:hypothetical protein
VSGDGFLVLTADRRTVGIFSTLRAASHAIGAAPVGKVQR